MVFWAKHLEMDPTKGFLGVPQIFILFLDNSSVAEYGGGRRWKRKEAMFKKLNKTKESRLVHMVNFPYIFSWTKMIYSWTKIKYSWTEMKYSWTKIKYTWTKIKYSWTKIKYSWTEIKYSWYPLTAAPFDGGTLWRWLK